MSIVFNENEWAAEMIRSRSLGKKPSETLRRVARYYIDSGCNKRKTRAKLDEFMLQCDSTCSIPKWADALDYAVSEAAKHKAINIKSITITKPEIDIINKISSTMARRLAFTLLCLAKYWINVYPDMDYWVISSSKDIMSMANINQSIKRQSMLFHELEAAGLIKFSKKVDNTNVRVMFVQDGESFLDIYDCRNLGYQYMKATGCDGFIECKNCGIIVKKLNAGKAADEGHMPQRYCRDCAYSMRLRQTVDSVMRHRKNT